jgi:ring-1,2-phenylacetyl-CoA epoxidase subunit PaaA
MATMLPATRDAVRDLTLVLADSKRLLGMRYAGWILGAPELETGIACASMAQDEWGHGRLLYALMRDFQEDVDRLEHGREPHEYANIEVLDASPDSWPALVALNAIVDSALTIQFEALRNSSHAPLQSRVEKLLEEEKFHAAHGSAWVRRLAASGAAARGAMKDAIAAVLPGVLRWYGPDDDRAASLVDAAVVDAAGSALRARLVDRLAPLLDVTGVDVKTHREPDFDGFDAGTRRVSRDGPDAATIEKVRGDRNRAFLMD